MPGRLEILRNFHCLLGDTLLIAVLAFVAFLLPLASVAFGRLTFLLQFHLILLVILFVLALFDELLCI